MDMLCCQTTVGFGDISPVTSLGRMIVSSAILLGSVVIPFQAAALAEAMLGHDREMKTKTKSLDDAVMSGNMNLDVKEDFTQSPDTLSARMNLIESKVDETNLRIERLISLLEAQKKKDDSSSIRSLV